MEDMSMSNCELHLVYETCLVSMPLHSTVTFTEECHPMSDCKLICRLQHTFYCGCKQAVSHEKLSYGSKCILLDFIFEFCL